MYTQSNTIIWISGLRSEGSFSPNKDQLILIFYVLFACSMLTVVHCGVCAHVSTHWLQEFTVAFYRLLWNFKGFSAFAGTCAFDIHLCLCEGT